MMPARISRPSWLPPSPSARHTCAVPSVGMSGERHFIGRREDAHQRGGALRRQDERGFRQIELARQRLHRGGVELLPSSITHSGLPDRRAPPAVNTLRMRNLSCMRGIISQRPRQEASGISSAILETVLLPMPAISTRASCSRAPVQIFRMPERKRAVHVLRPVPYSSRPSRRRCSSARRRFPAVPGGECGRTRCHRRRGSARLAPPPARSLDVTHGIRQT